MKDLLDGKADEDYATVFQISRFSDWPIPDCGCLNSGFEAGLQAFSNPTGLSSESVGSRQQTSSKRTCSGVMRAHIVDDAPIEPELVALRIG